MKARNITTYRWASAAIIAALVILCGGQVRADVLIDFGKWDVNATNSPGYNHINVATLAGSTNSPHALYKSDLSASGWTVQQVGMSGVWSDRAAAYSNTDTATLAPASIKDNYLARAWRDNIGSDGSVGAFITLDFAGLDNAKTYDLTFFGAWGKNSAATNTWSLLEGTGGNSSDVFSHSLGNAEAPAINYTAIAPESGSIQIKVLRDGTQGRALINMAAISETIPEPAAFGLILGGAGLLLFIRRRLGIS
jgi:hypothetical protein